MVCRRAELGASVRWGGTMRGDMGVGMKIRDKLIKETEGYPRVS